MLMAVVFGLGLAAGLFYHPFLVPWLLASALFVANFGLSVIFFKGMTRMSTSAAAGLAVVSFMIRLGLLGLGLLAIALTLPDYLLVTAISFLVVYTFFFAFEISIGIRGRKIARHSAAGGEA